MAIEFFSGRIILTARTVARNCAVLLDRFNPLTLYNFIKFVTLDGGKKHKSPSWSMTSNFPKFHLMMAWRKKKLAHAGQVSPKTVKKSDPFSSIRNCRFGSSESCPILPVTNYNIKRLLQIDIQVGSCHTLW
jgi:hypothetical protein